MKIRETATFVREKYLSDILFWIVLFFIIRLFNITSAPIESAHSWRQAFTNSVARNFLEMNSSFFYPAAPVYGNNPGITGTEFPLLNYLICLMAKAFGYAHWYGRLINLLVSSIGVWFFYKIVHKYVKPALAFDAAFLLLISLWFLFSRKSMPDTFSISILFIGLYYGLNFVYAQGYKNLLLYVLFTATGILCKIPSIYFLCIFAVPVFQNRANRRAMLVFAGATVLALIPVFWWYFKWVPYLESLYGNKLFFPRSLAEGAAEVFSQLGLTAERFYFSSFQSYVAFALFLAGIFFLVRNKRYQWLCTFVLLSIVFFIFILKTGIVFPLHSYYVLPYTPVMCVLAAYALQQIKSRNVQIIVLLVVTAEAIGNQQDDLFIRKKELYKLQLEAIADKVSAKTDLIAVNGGEDPQLIYFIHRKGWRISNEQAADEAYMRSLRRQGCKYLFLDKHLTEYVTIHPQGTIVYEDVDMTVYALN